MEAAFKVRLEVTEELDAKSASKQEAACCIKSPRLQYRYRPSQK